MRGVLDACPGRGEARGDSWRGLVAAGGLAVEAKFFEFAAEGVAVDAEEFGGAALVAVGAFHGGLEEALLEFLERFLEQNPTVNHL